MFDFIEQQGVGAGFVYKNTTNAYYFNGTTFNAITDPDYPATTVRGIVYLDGTYYVMTPAGTIYGSDLENPASWSALNAIQSRMEPDGGVCLARQLNMVVAFSAYSTEFFYDAGNPVGSPLSPFPSAFIEIGCAVAESVTNLENSIFFMGVSKSKGRSIYRLDGTSPTLISTASIDRILNKDNLVNVSAQCIKIAGHSFYILTLRNSGLTLVYDIGMQQWSRWTQLKLGTTQSITSLTWNSGVVTAVKTAHGLSDGDATVISASTPVGYNGNYIINVVDANTFTYSLASNPGTYTSGALVAKYTESYFDIASYAYGSGLDLVQDSTTGSVYALDTNTYQDNTAPIKLQIQTGKFDGGSNLTKMFSRLEIIGDKANATAYVRYSNDDYQTWSKFRPVDLSQQRSKLDRLGKGRRRAFNIINYDNLPIRLESLELTVEQGEQ